MSEQEPTTGELSRLIKRVEGTIGELRAEFREVAAEWRAQIAAAALIAQRVTQLESSQKDQEDRLRLVETDLAGRKENAEKSKRTNMWISTVIAVAGVATGVVIKLMGG
ncbi:hypothetical protein [Nonomuraea sp. NPDC003214]